jgi:hypothetical protein
MRSYGGATGRGLDLCQQPVHEEMPMKARRPPAAINDDEVFRDRRWVRSSWVATSNKQGHCAWCRLVGGLCAGWGEEIH